MTETPDSSTSPSITRAAAEEQTTSILDRVIATLPDGAVASRRTIDWTLLACSDTEVSAAGGAWLTLARDVDADAAYDAMIAAVRDDGYTATTDTTGKGAKRLTITGADDDQFLVTIYNDTQKVRISSFSQCFPGSLTDG
ncbi:hypothetical protein KZI27_08080 [Curtobacterium sp. TC1]|uniref:hypothetical protein n=1 Tax=Curtobacterium sp. TC1 TaxID=2862880 RepID=UPI001C9B0D80|nr:hypothetical protein [Curtobacterium sp. TC1]QZQ56750.1 hypothetical protein KZI27_08080 [Curtobacterium sp. TC1]